MSKKPDQFSYHEAMDRTAMIQDQMENALGTHPVLVEDRKMLVAYHRAMKAMNALRGMAALKCLKN